MRGRRSGEDSLAVLTGVVVVCEVMAAESQASWACEVRGLSRTEQPEGVKLKLSM